MAAVGRPHLAARLALIGIVLLISIYLPGVGARSAPPAPARPSLPSSGARAIAAATPAAPYNPPVLQDNWTEVNVGSTIRANGSSGNGPANRDQDQMAFDPALNETILFGGYLPTIQAMNDTWSFHDNTWTLLSEPVAPGTRWGGGLTWDAADGYLLLFGGRNETRDYNDTWAFNATGWHNLTRSVAPPPLRTQPVYDATDGYVVLCGGGWRNLSTGSAVSSNVTWIYSRGNWTNITTTAGYAPTDALLVDDPADGYVLAYGVGTPTAGEAWTFAGGRWSLLPARGVPTLTEQSANGAFDNGTGYVTIFGSEQNTADENLTWIYAGGVWTNLTSELNLSPPARGAAALAYDPAEGGLLLFGGDTPNNYSYWADAWLFRAVPYAARFAATPDPVDVDARLTLSAEPYENGGNFTYSVYGARLPPGCPTQSAASIVCAPTTSGSFAVALELNRSDGRSVWSNGTIVVHAAPSPSITASTPRALVNETLTFSATVANGTAPFTDAWSFGDGTSDHGTSVTHHFATAGNYTVRLNVSDAGGGNGSASLAVAIATDLAVTASTTRPLAEVGVPVSFTSDFAGGFGPWTVDWSFGDGTTGTGIAVNHTYALSGTMAVNCTVHDSSGHSAAAGLSLFLAPAPLLSLAENWTDDDAGLPVLFTATVTGGASPFNVTWNFGDGSTGYGMSPTHSFGTGGRSYTVQAVVVDALGGRSNASTSILVVDDPVILASVGVPVADAGTPIHFSSTTRGGIGPSVTQWSFTGGTGATGANVSASFAIPGTVSATARLVDSRGFSNESVVVVQVNALPEAAVSVASSSGCAGAYTVAFRTNVTGGTGPFTAVWSFGDNSSAGPSALNLTHVYLGGGPFLVEETVTDVDGHAARATVSVAAPAACAVPATPSGGSGNSLGEYLTLALIVTAVALVVVGAVLWSRRRAREPPEDPFPPEDGADPSGAAEDDGPPTLP